MVKEYKIKIINELESKKDDPLMWKAEIHEYVNPDMTEITSVNITSWDPRDLKEGLTYKIMLLDETGNDAAHDMRRMSKGMDPILVNGDEVVAEIIEEEPIKKKEIIWKKLLPKKETPKEAKTNEGPMVEPFNQALTPAQKPKDEFDEEFGSMIAAEEKEKETKLFVKSTQSLVIPKGNELEVNLKNIKKYLPVANVTDSEYYMFMQLCINQNLNPFIGDIYLVKYSTKAHYIVSKDAFLKKAELTKGYLGFEAGVVIFKKDAKSLIQRPGSLVLKEDKLVGGWARVHRKDMEPFYAEVSFDEYFAGGRSKKNLWDSKPATMIRKVALVQCLREAFPSSFQGMYDAAEMDTGAKQ